MQVPELTDHDELAETLAPNARDPKDFYRGETARRIVADMAAHDGIVTAADLAEYAPMGRKPLEGRYRGYTLLTMPPPSSGVTMIVMRSVPDACAIDPSLCVAS